MQGIWGQMGSWGSLVSQLNLMGELQNHGKPCLYDDDDVKTKRTTSRSDIHGCTVDL